MANKKINNNNVLYLIIGILIAFLLFKQGTVIEKIYIQNTTIIERLQEDNPATGSCSITSDQRIIVEGQTVTGRIKAKSNTHCDIYADYNSLGWLKIAEGTTSFSGIIELSEQLNLVGLWNFAAICGDCTTNQVDIEVVSKTGDYDGDGSTNEEEVGQGTDPFDSSDYPDVPNGDTDDCNAICVSLGYVSGRGPFDSTGWCNYPEDYVVIPSPSSADGCCCLPQEEEPEPEPDITTYTCGGETYGTCPPSHPNCEKVWYGLYEWAYTCIDINQNVHDAWKPDGVNYDLQDDTPPPTDEEICYFSSSYPHSVPLATTGTGTSYADNWCVVNCGGEGYFGISTQVFDGVDCYSWICHNEQFNDWDC